MGVALALVGSGRMGRAHLRAAEGWPGGRMVAAVEPLAPVREELRAAGLRAYASVGDLLEAEAGRGTIDGAIVAAPTPLHRAVTEPLLAAGVPVLCEKPCCLDEADTRALAQLAAARGVPLQVGYWRRFVPELVRLHDDIHAGRLGELSLVICQQWDKWPPPAAFRQSSGGLAVDLGVHEFDQLRWLTGQRVERLVGMAAGVRVSAPGCGPDSVALLAELSGGTVALISLGLRFPGGDMCRVEVIGTQAHADLPFLWPPTSETSFLRALRLQLDAFAATIAGDPPQGATTDDAIEALRLARLARAITG